MERWLYEVPWKVGDRVSVTLFDGTRKTGTVIYVYTNGFTLVQFPGEPVTGGLLDNDSTFDNRRIKMTGRQDNPQRIAPYRLKPPFVWKGNSRKSTTGHEYWYKRHRDGMLEVWLIEETTIKQHPGELPWVRYDVSQYFYSPGEFAHTNGKFLTDQRDYAHYASQFRRLGFHRTKKFPER